MSYPPPPGLKTSQPSSSSSTPQPHPSLPARPPPPAAGSASFKPAFGAGPSLANGAPGTGLYNGDSSKGGAPPSSFANFSNFKPRSVASSSAYRNNPPSYSSEPSSSVTQQSIYTAPNYQQGGYAYDQQPAQQRFSDSYSYSGGPQITNPFPQGGAGRSGGDFDPEWEAQVAQWNSAYSSRDDSGHFKGSGATGAASAGNANLIPLGSRSNATTGHDGSSAKTDSKAGAKEKTVIRKGGLQTWQDDSLLDWDPTHFRFFVGNLAGEVTDESLLKAFSKYSSVQKARVVREKRTTKSRGYGFVSMSDGDEYFQAAREMQGKYIGSHPIQLQRSVTNIKPVNPAEKNKGYKGKSKPGGHANTGAGVKKQTKTKGGLKILG